AEQTNARCEGQQITDATDGYLIEVDAQAIFRSCCILHRRRLPATSVTASSPQPCRFPTHRAACRTCAQSSAHPAPHSARHARLQRQSSGVACDGATNDPEARTVATRKNQIAALIDEGIVDAYGESEQ